MEKKNSITADLFVKAEKYATTNLELCKLKAVDKSADIISTLGMHLVIGSFISLCILILNVGVALWLGGRIGNLSYGFFVVAGFYAVVTLSLFLLRKSWIKRTIQNKIISLSLS